MTGSEGAIPDSQAADSLEPEPGRRSHRGWFLARATRAVRERWAVIRIAAIAVAWTLVVITASIAGWRLYDEWRVGQIELRTEGAPLVVQVLAEASDAKVEAGNCSI